MPDPKTPKQSASDNKNATGSGAAGSGAGESRPEAKPVAPGLSRVEKSRGFSNAYAPEPNNQGMVSLNRVGEIAEGRLVRRGNSVSDPTAKNTSIDDDGHLADGENESAWDSFAD